MTFGFKDVFRKPKPVLGMIHLAGSPGEKVKRALEELEIFRKEGVDGAIIENYCGSPADVVNTLKAVSESGLEKRLIIGVNILPNGFQQAIPLASEYGCKFVQIDYVAGQYLNKRFDATGYERIRDSFPEVIVLGGVHPKGYKPIPGSILEDDLKEGMQRAEAIVVTGEGTGIETPMSKIRTFRHVLGTHPFLIGTGSTPQNIYKQLQIADGVIVGTYLKQDHNTSKRVSPFNVRHYMAAVRTVRRLSSI